MKINRTTNVLAGFSCFLFAASATAKDISCQSLLDQINHLPPGGMSYNYQVNNAISPKALNQFLVSDCRSNPKQYTHFASERALQMTKTVVKDYLRNRS